MNVWTNEDGAVLTAELPGCDPAALEISVVDNTLSVTGKRAQEDVSEDVTYHRRERSCGGFDRTFELPFSVEASAVEATFENGVLQITLPRAEADKPKKIEITAG
jgi:HSP20 family protein